MWPKMVWGHTKRTKLLKYSQTLKNYHEYVYLYYIVNIAYLVVETKKFKHTYNKLHKSIRCLELNEFTGSSICKTFLIPRPTLFTSHFRISSAQALGNAFNIESNIYTHVRTP